MTPTTTKPMHSDARVAANRTAHRSVQRTASRSAHRGTRSWGRALESLSARHEAFGRRRRLQRELAEYRTSREVDDLLERLRDHQGADAEAMRAQLVRNRIDYAIAQRPLFVGE